MLSAKQFASGEGRLADVRGERCDFAVVGARKCSAAGGSPSGSRAILGGAGFAIVLGVTIMATRRRWEPIGVQVDPLQMMMNATDLSTERYHDFSLVFD